MAEVNFWAWCRQGPWIRCLLWVWGAQETWHHIRILKWGVCKQHDPTTFGFTGESSGCVMSLIRPDQSLHICQSHLAKKSVKEILSCCFRIRDTSWQIRSMPQHSLPYDWSSRAPENPQHTSWVELLQLQHSISGNRIWYWDTLGDIHYLGQNMRHNLLICGKTAAFASIWSMFRCTRKTWVHFHIATQSPHICQSQWQWNQSRWY